MQRARRPAELGLPRKAVRERVRLGHQLRFWLLRSLATWIGLTGHKVVRPTGSHRISSAVRLREPWFLKTIDKRH